VEIEADVWLDGPNSGRGPIVNANLVAVGPHALWPSLLAFNSLASNGAVCQRAGPVRRPPSKYQHLGLRLDFTQQTAEYFLTIAFPGIEPATRRRRWPVWVRLDLVGNPPGS